MVTLYLDLDLGSKGSNLAVVSLDMCEHLVHPRSNVTFSNLGLEGVIVANLKKSVALVFVGCRTVVFLCTIN